MNSDNSGRNIFPFLWPWLDARGEALSFGGIASSRKFTIAYLVIIWGLIAVLGFASTVDCESTWQYALQCKYAFWIKNLTDAPLIFIRNLFTTPFIHNGLDHILFVSVLGFFLMVQSHEAHFGSRRTIVIFASAYFIVAPFFAVLYAIAKDFYPTSEFLIHVLGRNWVGGSIGMFQVYGALATISRRPLVMIAIPVLFEIFNQLVIEIHPQISIMHLTCTFVGYGIASWLNKRELVKKL